MSRAYWVKLASSVVDTVRASDKDTHRIELDAVVPEGEMGQIVEGALEEAGWEKQEDDTWKKDIEGVTMTWDLDKGEVEAAVEASQDVERKVQVEGRAYSQDAAQKSAEQQLKRREEEARDAIGAEGDRLQKKLTKKLGDSEQERVREINNVLQKAYAEALKRKARRMGNVTSIQEGTSEGGEYELTITISE